MGLETGLKLGQKVITAWTKTGASDSMLAMRKININIDSLRLASKEIGDTIKFNTHSIQDFPIFESFSQKIKSAVSIKKLPTFDRINFSNVDEYWDTQNGLWELIKNTKFEQDITTAVVEAVNRGYSLDTVLAQLSKCKIKSSQIEEIAKTYEPSILSVSPFNVKEALKERNQILEELQNLSHQNPMQSGETLENYLKRLFGVRKASTKTNKEAYLQDIKSKLTYINSSAISVEKIELSQEEIAELRALLAKEYKKAETASIEELKNMIINARVRGRDDKFLTDRMWHFGLDELPNYVPPKGRIYDIEPVYRWIQLGDVGDGSKHIIADVEEFMKQFEPGKIYKPNRNQSCSKFYLYAENTGKFADSNPQMNIKFTIHPKGTTSKAKDLGMRKYGDTEVVYQKDEEFVVLGKRLEKFNCDKGQFYRWLIDLQEV